MPITLIGNNFQDVWINAKKMKEKGKMIAFLAKGEVRVFYSHLLGLLVIGGRNR